MSASFGWIGERLVCPRDGLDLRVDGEALSCSAGHEFAARDGVPVLLRDEEDSTHPKLLPSGDLREQSVVQVDVSDPDGKVDAYVQGEIVGTCGNFYRSVRGRLTRYPIPELQVVPTFARGRRLLDIGCNWGRWSIAAAQRGYATVGVDPNFEAVSAATRVARQLGAETHFVCADARWLPFRDETFDVVFSYSVFQHFRKGDVRTCLDEIQRVLVPGGVAVVEMPTASGLRNLYIQTKRRLKKERLTPLDFHVRYWRLAELTETFTEHIGPTCVEVDSYFFINGQPADRDLLPRPYQIAISASEGLKKVATSVTLLKKLADSVYVVSRKP